MNNLRNLRIKAAEKVRTNYLQSLMIPELINNDIRYRFFTYTSYIREDGIVEFYIEEIYEFVEENYENITKSILQNNKKIEIKNFRNMNYIDLLDLMAEYYELLEKVENILYSEKLLEMDLKNLKRLKEVFVELETNEVQEKVYKLICPNFIDKINQL